MQKFASELFWRIYLKVDGKIYPMSNKPLLDRTLVVISFYDQRSPKDLFKLLNSLGQHPSGTHYDICIVVNSTGGFRFDSNAFTKEVILHYRENTGMNIGAWDFGWQTYPQYRDYLFLQDECLVIKENWILAFQQAAQRLNAGMLGESINAKWSKSWQELRESRKSNLLPGHEINGENINRVDFYVRFMVSQGVDPGRDGRHLQSLIWYFTNKALTCIGEFPIGKNYGECIASEIAVSKKVESDGIRFEQLCDEPFVYIRHKEWEKFYRDAWQIRQVTNVMPYAQNKKFKIKRLFYKLLRFCL